MDIKELQRGTALFVETLTKLQDDDPEISDLHEAFERWAMGNYGDASAAIHTGAGGDLGCDFYSAADGRYVIGQCKVPRRDALEADALKIRKFGSEAVSDPRDALAYLLKDEKSKYRPNDSLKALYAQMAGDRLLESFFVDYHLIIWGKLNNRGEEQLEALKVEYQDLPIRIHLHDIDELVDQFVVGSAKAGDREIAIELHCDPNEELKGPTYRYVLANADDVFRAFTNYGWRLFDLNLRYEVRNSDVNAKIVESLTTARSRKNFHHYNNGLIIVCSKYSEHGGKLKIFGAQIVNGLQTVKSIYNAVREKNVTVEQLRESCRVPVKVIQSNDETFVAAIVQATNNQNPMRPRNLRSNAREQKTLRTSLATLQPRWFLQLKQEEWRSLSQEGGRFFKDVAGFAPSEFKVVGGPGRSSARMIDNEDLAKAWLAFTGYSDIAGDRTSHFFSNDTVYAKAFRESPEAARWRRFASTTDFRPHRESNSAQSQGGPYQYLLAYLILELVRQFVPTPQAYRALGLNEGVAEGKIAKSSGEFTSPATDQDKYLADNATYQTFRVMANMKELLAEALAFVLSKKYGPLEDDVCRRIIEQFDAKEFLADADASPVAKRALNTKDDLKREEIFGRTLQLLRFVAHQFWEDNRKGLSGASRLRTLLLSQNIAREVKAKIEEIDARKTLSRNWKPEGTTFVDSLPSLSN